MAVNTVSYLILLAQWAYGLIDSSMRYHWWMSSDQRDRSHSTWISWECTWDGVRGGKGPHSITASSGLIDNEKCLWEYCVGKLTPIQKWNLATDNLRVIKLGVALLGQGAFQPFLNTLFNTLSANKEWQKILTKIGRLIDSFVHTAMAGERSVNYLLGDDWSTTQPSITHSYQQLHQRPPRRVDYPIKR